MKVLGLFQSSNRLAFLFVWMGRISYMRFSSSWRRIGGISSFGVPPVSDDLPMRNPLFFSKVGQRGEGDEITQAAECVSERSGSAIVEMAEEQVWGLVSKELTSTMEVTFGSHSTFETSRSLDSYGFGKMGLDLSAPTHKVAFLEKPISQEMDELGPLRKKAFLGLKAGLSTTLLDLNPFFMKNH